MNPHSLPCSLSLLSPLNLYTHPLNTHFGQWNAAQMWSHCPSICSLVYPARVLFSKGHPELPLSRSFPSRGWGWWGEQNPGFHALKRLSMLNMFQALSLLSFSSLSTLRQCVYVCLFVYVCMCVCVAVYVLWVVNGLAFTGVYRYCFQRYFERSFHIFVFFSVTQGRSGKGKDGQVT